MALAEDLEEQFRAGGRRVTVPGSSTISKLRQHSCHWTLRRHLSYLASLSWWDQTGGGETRRQSLVACNRAQPRDIRVLPVSPLPMAMTFSRRWTHLQQGKLHGQSLVHSRDGREVEGSIASQFGRFPPCGGAPLCAHSGEQGYVPRIGPIDRQPNRGVAASWLRPSWLNFRWLEDFAEPTQDTGTLSDLV